MAQQKAAAELQQQRYDAEVAKEKAAAELQQQRLDAEVAKETQRWNCNNSDMKHKLPKRRPL